MIELAGVTKRYGDRPAVEDLSLTIEDGEFAVLLGPSGCGKTTTLRSINRMVDIDSGRITIDGVDVRDRHPDELRRHIGYGIQSVGLFPHMTVARNIGVVPRLQGWESRRVERRVHELLEMVGLDPDVYAAKRPRELSGGEAQRVGVARALAADPPVLLMDEPFGALDPLTRASLQDEFRRLQESLGKTVVFVTHDVEEAVVLADRIALLRDGRLVQYDTPEAMWQTPTAPFVREFFGRELSLKILTRHAVADVRLEPGSPDGLQRVGAGESLKDAMALMVSACADRLAVVEGDRDLGVLTFCALVSALRPTAADGPA